MQILMLFSAKCIKTIRQVFVLAASMFCLVSFELASAKEPEEQSLKAAYAAFQEAYSAGDLDKADTYAAAALAASEIKNGAHETTLVLASNLVQIRLWRDADAAVAPATRLEELVALGITSDQAPMADSTLLIAATKAFASSGTRQGRQGRQDRLALQALMEENGNMDTPFMANAWYRLAQNLYYESKWLALKPVAEKAEIAAQNALPDYDEMMADIWKMQAVSLLQRRHVNVKDMPEIMDKLNKAKLAFPPQKPETINFALTDIMTWQAAAGSIYATLDKRKADQYQKSLAQQKPRWRLWQDGPKRKDNCKIKWIEQKEIKYPEGAFRKYAKIFKVGAVIVMFDLKENGETENLRVIGELPSAVFGDSVLKGMSTWRAALHPKAAAKCYKNKIITHKFTIMRNWYLER